MTASLDTFAGLDASIWRFAEEPEFAPCTSRLWNLNGNRDMFLTCGVNHAEVREARHGAMNGSSYVRWSDEEAAAALAELLPERTCLGCEIPLKGAGFYGYCHASCRTRDRFAADEREVEVEL